MYVNKTIRRQMLQRYKDDKVYAKGRNMYHYNKIKGHIYKCLRRKNRENALNILVYKVISFSLKSWSEECKNLYASVLLKQLELELS